MDSRLYSVRNMAIYEEVYKLLCEYVFTIYVNGADMFGEVIDKSNIEEEGMKENKCDDKYIIGSIFKMNGSMSISKNPCYHYSLIEAKKEAERLSKVYNDKKFVVLKVEGVCSFCDVCWE